MGSGAPGSDTVSDDTAEGRSELDVDAEVELELKRKRVWPYLAGLLVVLIAGGAGAFYLSTRPDPKSVLVAVDLDGYWWEGSEASAIVTDQFALRLEELGFTPVKSGDPKVTALLESAASPAVAQRELRAGFLVTGRLEPKYVEHPIEGGYFEARTRGEVAIQYIDESPIQAGTVDGWSGAKQKARATSLLGEAVADRVFDQAIAALMEHPQLQQILAGHDAVERGKLQRAKGYVELRKQSLEKAERAYQELLEARKAAEQGGHDIKYHGAFDAEDALCAVSPQGFLSKQSRIKRFFSPQTNELRYYRELDQLRWVNFRGEATEVTQGYNLYSYPAASRDGGTLLYIEDIFGWAKAITVVRGKDAPQRLRVDPKHRFQAPRVAPGGKLAAMYDKPCRKCPSNLLVLELTGGKPVYSIDAKDGEVQGFDWISTKKLLVAFQPFAPAPPAAAPASEPADAEAIETPPAGLFEVDVSLTPPRLERVYEAGTGESFHWVRTSHDGKKSILPRRAPDRAGLGLFDHASGELSTYQVGDALPHMPEISPDGSAAVFEQNGEIVHYHFASQRLTTLTKNSARDRYPAFSPDAQRIYYESLGDDPNFSRRNVSIIASVAAP